MESISTTWNLNYESKTHAIDYKNSGYFSIKIQGIDRTLIRSPNGRETLSQQKFLGEKNARVRIVSEIPPAFLAKEKICSRYVSSVLSKARINNWIQHRIVPQICKDLIKISRHLEEEEKEGFLVEVEVEIVKETSFNDWLNPDDYDSEGRLIPIEEDCIICLEELSSGGPSTIMKLPCAHNFHKGCILPWLRRKRSCPTCRDDIHNPRPKKRSRVTSGGPSTIMKLPCAHNFHKGCILPWLRRKRSCPTCRDDIHNPRPKKRSRV